MELSNSNIKKFLAFSQKEAFSMFRETETPKKVFIFQGMDLSFILGNGNPEKILIFQKKTSEPQKWKKNPFLKSSLYFEELNF